jgi:hypothetical protein
MEPRMPRKLMAKAFYEFTGYFEAPETGVYYFELESCGPIDLKLGDQQVMRVDEQYGLSYKKRYGEVVLSKGAHPLRLVVTDIMYWKGDIEEPYTISLKVKRSGEQDYQPVASASLTCDAPVRFQVRDQYVDSARIPVTATADGVSVSYALNGGKPVPVTGNEIVIDAPGRYVVDIMARAPGDSSATVFTARTTVLEQQAGESRAVLAGADLYRYDRIALSPKRIAADGLPAAFFDTSDLSPYAIEQVTRLQGNDSTRKLLEYRGYLRIAREGIHQFKLHSGKEDAGQLSIAGSLVAQGRIAAPTPENSLYLKPGLHPYVFKVALGSALIYMKAPGDSDYQVVPFAALARDASPVVAVNGTRRAGNEIEFFTDSTIELGSPVAGAKVLYSTDGSEPSLEYTTPIALTGDMSLKTRLVKGGGTLGALRQVKLTRSSIPTHGLIGHLACESIEDDKTPVTSGGTATAVVTKGVLEPGKKGKALGFYEDASRISLRNLETHEDASTVSMWIKVKGHTDFLAVTGIPFRTEEYDLAFRGRYIQAEFKRYIGMVRGNFAPSLTAPGTWFHLAASYGDENRIYLNGELIGQVQVMNKQMRRGSGRAADLELMVRNNAPTDAAMDEFRIYDRVLSAEEIRALYEADK